MTERVYPTSPFTHIEWIGGRRPASGSTRLLALESVWRAESGRAVNR